MDREAGKASSCEAGPAVWVPALVAGRARSHATWPLSMWPLRRTMGLWLHRANLTKVIRGLLRDSGARAQKPASWGRGSRDAPVSHLDRGNGHGRGGIGAPPGWGRQERGQVRGSRRGRSGSCLPGTGSAWLPWGIWLKTLVEASRKAPTLGKTEGRRRRGNRGWDGWMASPTQWPWVWANSGRWWRTGQDGVLPSTGLQRAGHDLGTEQQQK